LTRVGTAAWAIPSRYKERMPVDGSHLERYAQRLNAVEINSSFHRHHQLQTYERWAASVPRHFRFSVKLPQALTHEGALTAMPEVLDRFKEEVSGLGSKLAVLLLQLPPSLELDARAARRFFAALRKRFDVKVVCEPRHPSWGAPRADRLLAGCGVARVAANPAPWPGADEPGGFAKLAYFRWHGKPRKYYSDYDSESLAALKQSLVAARRQASDVWCIFDNTAHGFALGNALATADTLAR
jgi:uncharacterized protein YecE (DUF72 family)